MNPLNRKMFRDPRAARRATGILASSAPLMTSAQKAMAQGQPMRAQTGAAVNTRRRTALEDLAALPSDVRAGLGMLGVPRVTSETTDQLKRAFLYPLEQFGMPVPANAPGKATPLSNVYKPTSAAGMAMPDEMTGSASSMFGIESVLGAGEAARPKGILAASDVITAQEPPVPLYPDMTVPAKPAPGPGESAAATRSGAGQDPTVTPTGGEPGGGELSPEDEMLIAAQGRGRSAATEAAKDLLRETKEAGGKVSAPTITPSTVTLPSGFDDTDVPSTGTETTTGQTKPEDALPDSLKGKRSPGKGVSATKEAAAQNDALLNISDTKPDGKPLTYKERVEARFEVLKDLIGEDQAKDIRTDKNYNLMMLGLRIAAGQDPNALSNIAAGAGQQLQEFGEVSGEESQRRAEKIESLTMLAASDVSEEMKAEAARDFAKSEREATQLFQAGEAEKGRDFQFDMNMFDKNFASLESSLNRQHDMATRILGEKYQNIRAKNAADLQIAIRNANSQDQINLAVANYQFQADMAQQGRVFDLDKLMIQQEFAKEQGVDDREFRAKLAMMPPDTQRIYERFLTDEQAVSALLAKKTGDNNDRDKARGIFIRETITNVESRAAMEDALSGPPNNVPPDKMDQAIAERAAQIYDNHVWPLAN